MAECSCISTTVCAAMLVYGAVTHAYIYAAILVGVCHDVVVVLRGGIVNKTYGAHKNLPGIYLPIFPHNIWSYVLWSAVIV